MKNLFTVMKLAAMALSLLIAGGGVLPPAWAETASDTVQTTPIAAATAPDDAAPNVPPAPASPPSPDAPSPPPAPEAPEPSGGYMGNHETHPIVFNDLIVEPGQTNFGDAVVFKGSTTINGAVNGDSVTVLGDAKVNGSVGHDLVVVLGSLELGPKADIGGNVTVVGGKLKRARGAKILGEVVEVNGEKIPGFRGALAWVTHGLLLGHFLLPFGVAWPWVVAGILLLVNLLLLLMFPQPIQACVDMVEGRPITSFFTGILVKLLAGLLIVLLAISVVGIIAIPFMVAGMVVAFLFGKISIYRYVGQQLGRQTGVAALQTPALTLIIGTAIFYLLYAVPFLGFVAWGFTSLFGVGAVALATLHKFRSERPKTSPPAAPAPETPVPPAPEFAPAAPVPPGPQPSATAAATGAAATLAVSVPPEESQTSSATGAPPPFPRRPPGPPPVVQPNPLEVSVLPRAGFWIRLCALGLDFALFLVLFLLLHILFYPALVMLAWLAYNVGLWTWKGTTIGGIITGLKVVRVDGRPLDAAVALVRALAAVLSAFVLGLGFFWAGFSEDKQSWHDKIAGTVIVKVPKSMPLL